MQHIITDCHSVCHHQLKRNKYNDSNVRIFLCILEKWYEMICPYLVYVKAWYEFLIGPAQKVQSCTDYSRLEAQKTLGAL